MEQLEWQEVARRNLISPVWEWEESNFLGSRCLAPTIEGQE